MRDAPRTAASDEGQNDVQMRMRSRTSARQLQQLPASDDMHRANLLATASKHRLCIISCL